MPFAHHRVAALVIGAAVLLMWAPAAAAQTAGWQGGPEAILDNTYDGFIDAPQAGASVPGSGSFDVNGWFVDRTAQGWAGADDVQVWLGTMDGGGRMLAKAVFAQARPDVAAVTGNPFWSASGFIASVPGSSVPGGGQTLNVYVHTPAKGWWFKSVTVTGGGSAPGAATASAASAGGAPEITIINPTDNQDVSTKGDYTINGTVSDATNVDNVEVWINGERDTRYASPLGTTTPDRSGSWSLTFMPTKYPSAHSLLFIYARNRVSGVEALATREINIVDR